MRDSAKTRLPNIIDSHFKTEVSSFALRKWLLTGILTVERIRLRFVSSFALRKWLLTGILTVERIRIRFVSSFALRKWLLTGILTVERIRIRFVSQGFVKSGYNAVGN